VRPILSVILAVALAICPSLCEEVEHGRDASAARFDADGQRIGTSVRAAPGPCDDRRDDEGGGCPEGGGTCVCICEGAIRPDDDGHVGPDDGSWLLAFAWRAERLGPSRLTITPPLPFGPISPGLASRVDARTARALLQNFRC